MILQFDVNTQYQNLIRIAIRTHGEEVRSVSNIQGLKKIYVEYLEKMQNRNIGFNPKIRLVTDPEMTLKLVDIFNGKETTKLDDKNQREIIELGKDDDILEKVEMISDALCILSKHASEYSELLNVLITDIFLRPSKQAKGGSSSDSIGVIWANPRLDFSQEDMVEFLVHELTHNCMFVDEHRHGHYHYENIMNEKNWAQSAILQTLRPIDKVLHSIVVSLEIILFRDHFNRHPKNPKVHPPSEVLIAQLKESIESISSIVKVSHEREEILLKKRAVDILNNAKKIISNY